MCGHLCGCDPLLRARGLLRPAQKTGTGYRLFDEEALRRIRFSIRRPAT